jgi:surface antigen
MRSRIAAAPFGQRVSWDERRGSGRYSLELDRPRGLLRGSAIAPTPAAGASPPPAGGPDGPATLAIPTGAALGGLLGGPVGASLTDDDRQAAWDAQVAALDSGQKRSWRGAKGVFGFVEPGAATGNGCRAYSQTIYVAGRPNRGGGLGCKQPDGSWKMTS